MKQTSAALAAFAATALSLSLPATSAESADRPAGVRNIVLVHGAWVDGSGWQAVYRLLRHDGYNVSIVQNPLSSLADDVAATRRVLAAQSGPAILVGHSWGGAVITEAGTDPKVAALVYVAAFIPDAGESIEALSKNPPPGSPVPPLVLPPQDGFLFLDRTRFHAAFAADVSGDEAAFMADAQAPWGYAAFAAPISVPAWKAKPSWALVPTDDMMIGRIAEEAMAKRAGATVIEVKGGSHAIYLSQPKAVVDVIEKAAATVKLAAN
jgi:pimeloyl-ACP methyl ester carboxylesterase